MKDQISIIGAGIGGLTAGIILQRAGFQVNVYESTSTIKPVGAGIIMAINAMQIFKELNLHTSIEAAGNPLSQLSISDAHLKKLNSIKLSEFEKQFGATSIGIHRAALHEILVNALGIQNIHLSKKLNSIEKDSNGLTLLFDDNTSVETEAIIGADGIHSIVRNHIFGNQPLRDSNQLCWRGTCIAQMDKKYDKETYEAWGTGRRFGFVKIGHDKYYWYAVMNKDSVPTEPKLTDIFKDFHPDIQTLIKNTPLDTIHEAEIKDLTPLDSWSKDKICLLGDAAHATTPNLGQGACQAVEDAYVLGLCLEKDTNFISAFKHYELLRKPKADYVVNASRQLGKFAHINNSFVASLRNSVLKFTPAFVNKKPLQEIFDINYSI